MSVKRIGIWVGILLISMVVGCSPSVDQSEEDHKPIGVMKEKIAETSFGQEIGFQLDAPTYKKNEIATSLTVKGKVEEAIDDQHIWIVISGSSTEDFEYYTPIENGTFNEEITVHEGKGTYEISMRAPSNKPGEEDTYYDVATFTVENTDDEVKQDVTYTKFGMEQHVQIEEPTVGMNEVDEDIFVKGHVGEAYESDVVLVEIEKDDKIEQLTFPVVDQTFSGDIPLYFGEGNHKISVQLYNEDDEYYHQSAIIYADNQVDVSFAQFDTYKEAGTYGIKLDSPTYTSKELIEDDVYEIKGTIDTSLPNADEITHVITNVYSYEEDEEASYIFPIVDGSFDGEAYFRFGPGEYEVQMMIPDITQPDEEVQYFQTIANAYFEVDGVEDQRDLLPSQGIESDNVSIIEQAEEITEGITSEREIARAIYAFVAQNVAYDVEKYETENSFTRLYDSAIEALDSGKGVCQDYAYLAIALFRSLGMEAHYVIGDAGELHAWVEVKVDGEWIEMDPTWGAGYVDNNDEFHFNYDERYFDPDPAFLNQTHTREEIRY